MRKRIISLLLTVCLVAAMVVVPTYGTAENVSSVNDICPCGCGKALRTVKWKAYDPNVTGSPANGHYYLADDYAQKASVTIMSGERVVLDLRGHTLTTTKACRIAEIQGYMAVLDTAGGGMISNITSGTAYGGTFALAINETPATTFEFVSGTIAPIKAESNQLTAAKGGVFYINDDCRLIMRGGVIMNAATSSNGGVIHANGSSQIHILGGTIMGSSSGGYGGNIYCQTGKVVLENCKILGGTAVNGGNICLNGAELTANNATIAHGAANTATSYGGGNICALSNSTLSITDSAILDGYAMNQGGNISMTTGTYGFTNTRILGGVAEKGSANMYSSGNFSNVTFKNCTLPKDLTAACPHCDQQVTWYDFGSALGNHWRLTGDNTAFAGLTTVAGQDIVLDLQGYDLTATGRAFTVAAGSTLTVLDSKGGSVVSGSGIADENGGVILNAGTLNLYGGKYAYVKNAAITVAGGGVVCNDGTLNLHDVILDGSAYENTAEGAYGGAIYQTNGTEAAMHTFTMSGGRILGGRAYQGGSLYMGQYGDITITGGTVVGGSAWDAGGNIYCYGGSYSTNYKFRISDCAVLDGSLANGKSTNGFGGNLYMSRYEVTLDNCYVRGGDTTDCKGGYGGNIQASSMSLLKATDTILADGNATKAGGNYYASNGSSDLVLTNCLVLGGKAGTRGGNLSPAGGLTIQGGMVVGGTAATEGGNIYHSGGKPVVLTADEEGNPAMVVCGTAATGGNLYTGAAVELTAAYISGGTAEQGADIYKDGSGDFIVGKDLTGDVKLTLSSTAVEAPGYGMPVLGSACAQGLSANITLDETYNSAKLLAKDGKLYIGSVSVIDKKGNETWYATNAEAVAACGENSYVKLYMDGALQLTKDLFVDVNGKQVTVTGDYALYGMDSSGDAYTEPAGTVSGTPVANVKTCDVTYAPNGKLYVAVAENGAVKYHCLGMEITTVTVRPSADGMYYTGQWSCDDTIKGMIDTYGVVVSVDDMPDGDFKNDDANLWTVFGENTFESGVKKTGAVIDSIMMTPEDKADITPEENDVNGRMPIYAKAYICFDNGSTYVSADNVGTSLRNVMRALDNAIYTQPIQFRSYTQALRSFYNKWKDNGMGNWGLKRIPEPEDDGVMDVLMIGSSFCYYYVEELYALAEAAGIPMRVCNAYYSGCRMVWHYEWWQNGESMYQFYNTDGNGRKQTSNVSLEWCLAQDEWDVISIQESGIYRNYFLGYPDDYEGGLQYYLDSNKQYSDALIPYLQEQFPNADIYWHQTWADQVGYSHSKYNVTAENADVVQPALTKAEKTVAEYMCETYGIERIPCGEAWMVMRDTYDYDQMCARLGVSDHKGDYHHEGDIGGGQYLNACVWFEMITGKSVLGNTYKPDYKTSSTISSDLLAELSLEKTATGYALSDELIAQLQQAAHDTVATIKEVN